NYSYQRIPANRVLDAPAPSAPWATPAGAAHCGLRMTSSAACELSVAAHIPSECAKTRDERCVPGAALHRGHILLVQLFQGHPLLVASCSSLSRIRLLKSGAASGGAVSTQVLAQRRRRDSPHFVTQSLEQSMTQYLAQTKLIVFIDNSTNGNG